MKRRMSVARCCCSVCEAGETNWSDDFSSYTEGESLAPYGYVGGGATAKSGTIEVVSFTPTSMLTCPRASPFQYNTQTELSFELKIAGNTFQDNGAPTVGTMRLFDIGAVNPQLTWKFNNNPLYEGFYFTSSVSSDFVATTLSIGDTLKLVFRKTSFSKVGDSVTVNGEVDYYHNGSLLATKSHTQTADGIVWCLAAYGVYVSPAGSYGLIRTDDWVFSAT